MYWQLCCYLAVYSGVANIPEASNNHLTAMPLNITEDHKTRDLIGRVGDDVAQLRSDIASLFSHTGRHTIPESARELRAQARQRLSAGGEYAVTYLRQHPGKSSVGILGGLLLLGAVGTGIFYLCKGRLPCCCDADDYCEYELDDEETGDYDTE